MSEIVAIREEVAKELANPKTLEVLIATTFKGLNQAVIPQAIIEGRIRGFTFKNFLEKDVYAVPYGQSYSLVTSIDYARKIGMASGVVGKDAPIYTTKKNDAGKDVIDSCSVTIKRKVENEIGSFTATVFFDEYTTGRNLWTSKPRTMLAKVAEMHALRMACPEKLAQAYAEEEIEKTDSAAKVSLTEEQLTEHRANLLSAQTLADLAEVWAALPPEAKNELTATKEEMKKKLTPAPAPVAAAPAHENPKV